MLRLAIIAKICVSETNYFCNLCVANMIAKQTPFDYCKNFKWSKIFSLTPPPFACKNFFSAARVGLFTFKPFTVFIYIVFKYTKKYIYILYSDKQKKSIYKYIDEYILKYNCTLILPIPVNNLPSGLSPNSSLAQRTD